MKQITKTSGSTKWKALGIILSVLCVFALQGQVVGQNKSCYDKTTYVATKQSPIRKRPEFAGGYDLTRKGQTLRVIGSRKIAGVCWIQTPDGWLSLPRNSPSTSVQADSTPITESPGCYRARVAYVTGTVNIRSVPRIDGRKVGTAWAGESFTVSNSQRGGNYCWLKTSKGWIAKTARVQSTKPAPAPAIKTCPPVTEGDTNFRAKIKRACALIAQYPQWRNYLLQSGARSIGVLPLHILGAGRAEPRNRQIEITDATWHTISTPRVSGVIIHEACHIYQINAGRYTGRNRNTLEAECYKVELDYMTQVDPESSFIPQLRDKVRQYGG